MESLSAVCGLSSDKMALITSECGTMRSTILLGTLTWCDHVEYPYMTVSSLIAAVKVIVVALLYRPLPIATPRSSAAVKLRVGATTSERTVKTDEATLSLPARSWKVLPFTAMSCDRDPKWVSTTELESPRRQWAPPGLAHLPARALGWSGK